jgi:mono/diheme cytochrome c family protein
LVAKLASLTTLLYCLIGAPASAAEPRPSCLACHPVHYADRGGCTGCHRGNPASARKNIAHHLLIAGKYASFTLGDTAVFRRGNLLLDQLGCRRCHQSGGRGNRFATSLDTLLRSKPAEEIARAIHSPAQGMPDFGLREGQISALVNAVIAGGVQAGKPGRERPLTVHFQKTAKESTDLFSRKCVACHRILAGKEGMLGMGEIGPNLSGLLSEFYPASFPGGRRWTPQRVRGWIENPRRFKTNALMQPVMLDDREFRELETLLGAGQE